MLPGTLRRLYRNLGRHALYVSDERDDLVPFAEYGNGRDHGAPGLLASLRSRLPDGRRHRAIARAHLFPSGPGVESASVMSVPLVDARTLAGLVVVEAQPATPDFSRRDLDALKGIAALFSLALQRLRSRGTGHARPDIELDRRSASAVQRRLMGRSLPPGLVADARYLPALDVGGDFYELTDLGDGAVGGAIGDVSGKGVSAALIMSRVSSDVRRALRSGVGPSAVLREVNDTLADIGDETFVTACCIRLDGRRRKLTVANAGHVPLFIRRGSGEVFTFGASSGTPLGMMPCDYGDEEIDFGPLDVALLVTDGLVEALDRPGDRMGVEFMLRLLKNAPPDPKVVNGRILGAVNRRKRSKALDDVTLVALRLEA